MKTKNFFRLFFVGALAILALSCDKTKDQPQVKGFNVAKMSVQIADITATTATAQVSVTENEEALWYGFVTEDLETPLEELVEDVVGSLTVSKKILNKGSQNLPLVGLIPGGFNYRYVVTGLAADGRTYGTPVETFFRTSSDFAPNELFQIEYFGTVNDPENGYITALGFSGIAAGEYFSYTVVDAETYEALGVAEIISQDAENVIRNDLVKDAICDAPGDDYMWEQLDPGNYVIIMYGVDEDFNPTMKYAVLPITVEAPSDVYTAYLGNWYTEEGDLFVITPATINQGYYVTGFNGDEAVEAELSADGALVFNPQIAATTSSAYHVFVGITDAGGVFINGPIAYAVLGADGTTMTLSGLPVSETNSTVAITILATTNLSSWKTIDGAMMLDLPVELSSIEPQPLDTYTAWIGSWYSPDVDQFEIKKGIINKTLLMSGFYPDMDVELVFDKVSGEVAFYSQLVGEDDNYYYVFTGKDQDDYIEDASQADDLLGVGTMAADGKSFELEGNVFDAVYSGTTYNEIIVSMGVYVTPDGSKWGQLEDAVNAKTGTFTDEIPTASDEFLAWIGDWDVVRVPEISHDATQDDVDNGDAENIGDPVIDQVEIVDTWTIAEKKVNASYTITGIEGLDWVEAEATFDSSDGSINLAQQQVLETDYINGYIFSEAYGGVLYYGYYGDIFYGYIDNEKEATLYPYDDYFAYNGRYYNFDVESFHVYGEVGDNLVFWNDEATVLPTSMEKADATQQASAKGIKDWKKAPVHNFVELPANGVDRPAVRKTARKVQKNGKALQKRQGSKATPLKKQGQEFTTEPLKFEKKVPQSELRGKRINNK